jgi:serine/threonine-protein kinase
MGHVSGQLRPLIEVNPEVPEGINAVTVRLLAKDPKDRYQDAAELIDDLERVQRGESPVLGSQQAASLGITPTSLSDALDSGGRPRPREQKPAAPPASSPLTRPEGTNNEAHKTFPLALVAGLVALVALVGVGIVLWAIGG